MAHQLVAALTSFAPPPNHAEAGEHLQLLISLGREIERSMSAISGNRLDEFEDSVACQRELSSRLQSIVPYPAGADALQSAAEDIDPEMAARVRSAALSLRQLNQRYAILLSHSSETVAQLSSLFRSYRGQIAPAPGAEAKHQTASWQV